VNELFGGKPYIYAQDVRSGVVSVPKGWLEVDSSVIGLTVKVKESRL
jgi:hypothetical protein